MVHRESPHVLASTAATALAVEVMAARTEAVVSPDPTATQAVSHSPPGSMTPAGY